MDQSALSASSLDLGTQTSNVSYMSKSSRNKAKRAMFETDASDPDRLQQLPLWVDAICINQDDKKEKAKQVPNMHQIYSTAKEVLLWLGTMPIPPDFLKPWIDNEKYSWIRFDQEDCSMGQELREDALERYALFLRSSQFPIQALSRQPSGSPRKQQLMHFATASEMFTFRHHLWLDDMQPREGDRIVKPNGREKGAFFMRPRRDGTFQLLGRLAASGTSLLAPGKRIEVTLI
ncbi:hypothetical protein ACJ41O_003437 [Fusarium nematophilum]